MLSNIVVVGAQWGDEGKGKVVDVLAESFDVVARYQGGANAGHTVIVGGKKVVLQLSPTGLVRPEKTAVIGNGVVVDPDALLREIDTLEQAGISVGKRLLVSDRAHLIFPYHRTYEAACEQARGGSKIGTTAKGIGPCYEDKAARRGLRMGDLRNPEEFRRKASAVLAEKSRMVAALGGACSPAEPNVIERVLATAPRLVPLLGDCSLFLNGQMALGKRVLFEGAQGTLLDLDHGTYPFVTSSNATAGGACTGTGVGPTRIDAVIGISKAYTTRVGSGPFPTEALGEEGETLRNRGGEYGAVTGRPRRCGWFDVPLARYSARVNGLSALVITKLDILDHLAEIPVGVEYEYRGKKLADLPTDIEVLGEIKVRYQTVPGWQAPTFGLREYSRLPQRARDYLRFLTDQVGVEIAMVSTGPERNQVIWLDESLVGSQLRPARP